MKGVTAPVVSQIIVILTGLYALALIIPGFRPKQVRDSILGMISDKGIGVLVYFSVMLLLFPAARRLKNKGLSQTLLESFFISLSLLLTVNIIFELLFMTHNIALWAMRLIYVAIVIWGFWDSKECKALFQDVRQHVKSLWRGLGNVWWKIFAGLVFFFFLRQELHYFLTRPAPYGDEISWWYTGAQQIMNEGLRMTMLHHSYGYYTPAIPWLIALPNRLLGIHHEAWLYGYPLFIAFCYLFLILDLARSSFSFLASFVLLFFTLTLNRDLHHQIGATFYGEAIAGLLTAVLGAHIYLAYVQKSRSTKFLPSYYAGIGLFLSFCIFSKPPLSILVQLLTPCVILLLLIQKGHWKQKLISITVFFIAEMLSYQIWKSSLATMGHHPEYSVTLHEFLKSGIDLKIPMNMFLGLGSIGSYQFAFTAGLVASLVMALSKRDMKLFSFMCCVIFLYWGFVFGLYATLWQRGDYNSTGRYLLHGALACIVLVSLVSRKYVEEKVKVYDV